ncbi:hypothetical protein OPT61_g2900 [Boeremia exigua]|uniref:Uncharacterized protein n=1 Tax=Boeremia exigua TaxID=749465 RepID=A0ACC2IJU8_9PLEO|nr:hypothetical protein OPT61_g2900 [Boeremia exigua]
MAASRVLVLVYPRSPLFTDSDPEAIRQHILKTLGAKESDVTALYLATWPNITHMVLDICNYSYDFTNAHQVQDIPVTVVYVRGRESPEVTEASADLKNHTNNQIARQHNLRGYDALLPMIDDHRNGKAPVHLNPRDIK